MSTSEPLSCLHEGQRARVLIILESGAMRRRLQDIGLIEGTTVECVQKSPAGDPVAYGIRGAIVALRAEQATAIIVQR